MSLMPDSNSPVVQQSCPCRQQVGIKLDAKCLTNHLRNSQIAGETSVILNKLFLKKLHWNGMLTIWFELEGSMSSQFNGSLCDALKSLFSEVNKFSNLENDHLFQREFPFWSSPLTWCVSVHKDNVLLITCKLNNERLEEIPWNTAGNPSSTGRSDLCSRISHHKQSRVLDLQEESDVSTCAFG